MTDDTDPDDERSDADGSARDDDRAGADEATADAQPGRRTVDNQGDPVEGVAVLRRVPTDTDALVTVETDEATAWCPYEGTADYYALRLAYRPGEYAVELMSYRDYLQTFRDEDLGHEEFAERVYDDLVAALDPDWLRLTVEAPPRYGLEMTIRHQTAPMPASLRETAPVEARSPVERSPRDADGE